MIKGFFFDLDGTLIDTYQADYLAYRDAIKQVTGVDVSQVDFAKTNGQEMKQKLDWLGIEVSESEATEIAQKKKAYYPKYLHLTSPNTNLIKHLADLAEHHAIVLVTTAKRDNAMRVLKKYGIEKYFSHLVFGDEIDRPKPHPEAYLKGLQMAKLKPDEVIAFEDSSSGIAAAEAAGIAVVQIRAFDK